MNRNHARSIAIESTTPKTALMDGSMRRTWLALAAGVLAACSSVEVRKARGNDEGLRFYRPDLYLLVGAEESSVIALPNKNEEYVVRPKLRLGSVDVKVEIDQGWNLTGLGTTIDGPETIAALGSLVGAFAEDTTGAKVVLEPGLYEILYTSGKVSGLRKVVITLQ